MIFRKDLLLQEVYKIRISDDVRLKLEDGIKKKDSLLIDIDASHFGFKNKNGTIYRHDTVRDCIPTYVYPNTKPTSNSSISPKPELTY